MHKGRSWTVIHAKRDCSEKAFDKPDLDKMVPVSLGPAAERHRDGIAAVALRSLRRSQADRRRRRLCRRAAQRVVGQPVGGQVPGCGRQHRGEGAGQGRPGGAQLLRLPNRSTLLLAAAPPAQRATS